ncbi:MAG: DUF3043 domain-containing protein [Ornithinimicrobium sp.]
MKWSKKTSAPDQESVPVPEHAGQISTGKGRPTPKRRESEAARRRPLVVDTRGISKDAKQEQKRKRQQARAVAREGMMRGDQKYLAARDRGPQRRYLRDAVDRRWNIGEILLPTMLLILAASLVRVPGVQLMMFAAAYGLILFGLLDAILLWRRTKLAYIREFNTDTPRGSASYVVLRSFQMRRSRVPRAQVNRGEELRRH